jgi:hypothetical protein
MKRAILTRERLGPKLPAMKGLQPLAAAILIGSLSGCVQVAAPDKPIEINLNINIRQEVVVRLQEDVRDLIKKNPGVF